MKIGRARIILVIGGVVFVSLGLALAKTQARELSLFEEIPDTVLREYLSPESVLFEEIPVVLLEQQNSEEINEYTAAQARLVA